MERGCTWHTPHCAEISTVAEAQHYVRAHGSECVFNQAVVEEREHRRQQERVATIRREAAEAVERVERDYRRQREAQEAEASAAHRLAAKEAEATRGREANER